MKRKLIGVTLAVLLGCSRTADQKPEKAEGAITTTLTLTAAQVAHGKIAWSPVTMGTTSASATVPGQIATDEDRTVRLGAPARGRVISVSVSPGDR